MTGDTHYSQDWNSAERREQNEMFKNGSYPNSILVRTDDAYIVNSLTKSEVDYPTIFSLMWGPVMACSDRFPPKLKKIVSDMLQEEKKKNESYDIDEKKLHQIIIDLLQVLYEKEVNDICEICSGTG